VSVNDPNLDASSLTISQKIMGVDNYICGMISDVSLLTWKIPDLRPIPMSYFFVPLLRRCLVGVLIDDNGHSIVNQVPLSSISEILSSLNLRLRLVGAVLALLSPFILPFQVACLLARYVKSRAYRSWSPLGQWTIREYNELPHFCDERLQRGAEWASIYLNLWPSPIFQTLLTILTFLSCSVLLVFGILAVLTDVNTVLQTRLFFGKSVAWISVFLCVFVKFANSSPIPKEVTEDFALAELEKVLRYSFRDESHSSHSILTLKKVASFFPSFWTDLLYEMLSVIGNPFLFLVFLPERSSSIVEFLRKNSAEIEFDWVCAFSTFDVGDRGFIGSADHREKVLRSLRSFEEMNGEHPLLSVEGISEQPGPESQLVPRPASPLVRTDFGSHEQLSNLDKFFAYPTELESDL
jgi:autophagy-related protein 9